MRRKLVRNPRLGQNREESRLATRQSVTIVVYPRWWAHANAPSTRASPMPVPRTSGSVACQPRMHCPSGTGKAVVHARLLDRRHDHAADDPTASLGDQASGLGRRDLRLTCSRNSSGGRSRGWPRTWARPYAASRPAGRVHQLVDVFRVSLADARRPLLGGHLPDAVGVLLSEREPEPGVDERRIGGGNDGVVPGASRLHPGPRHVCVQIADGLRLCHGVPGVLDPPVRAPDLRRSWATRPDTRPARPRGGATAPAAPSCAQASATCAAASAGSSYRSGSSGSTARWLRCRSVSRAPAEAMWSARERLDCECAHTQTLAIASSRIATAWSSTSTGITSDGWML